MVPPVPWHIMNINFSFGLFPSRGRYYHNETERVITNKLTDFENFLTVTLFNFLYLFQHQVYISFSPGVKYQFGSIALMVFFRSSLIPSGITMIT